MVEDCIGCNNVMLRNKIFALGLSSSLVSFSENEEKKKTKNGKKMRWWVKYVNCGSFFLLRVNVLTSSGQLAVLI